MATVHLAKHPNVGELPVVYFELEFNNIHHLGGQRRYKGKGYCGQSGRWSDHLSADFHQNALPVGF
jgi:hypothetical protein